jgi:hypothetical protein
MAKKYPHSTGVVLDVMEVLSGERGKGSHLQTLRVQATVGNEVIVDDDVPVLFTVYYDDKVRVSPHWEDAGYKGYSKMGLFGYSDSPYSDVRYDGQFMFMDSPDCKLRFTIPKR